MTVTDEMVAVAAEAVERATTKTSYGWNGDQFQIWWNQDPLFVEKVDEWGYFRGTAKQKLFWETRIALEAALQTRKK